MDLAASHTRTRRLWPFAALAMLGLLLPITPGAPSRGTLWLIAAALTSAVAAAVIRVPWQRLPGVAQLAPALVYLLTVALLRHASGGANGGVGLLVLLPVVWMAMYGTPGRLYAVIGGVGISWILPLVAIGAPAYPESGWRTAVLLVALASMIGATVQGLIRRVRRQADELRERDRERTTLLERLEQLATTDALTGLPNRRTWAQEVAGRLEPDEAAPVCVAMLDLDHFKALNDTFGHQAGDEALRATAHAWRAELRPGDLLVRLGGDEFAVVLSGCSLSDAVVVIDRLRANAALGLTCSAGVAQWDGHEARAELEARADALLYHAKRAGRDRCAVADLDAHQCPPRASDRACDGPPEISAVPTTAGITPAATSSSSKSG